MRRVRFITPLAQKKKNSDDIVKNCPSFIFFLFTTVEILIYFLTYFLKIFQLWKIIDIKQKITSAVSFSLQKAAPSDFKVNHARASGQKKAAPRGHRGIPNLLLSRNIFCLSVDNSQLFLEKKKTANETELNKTFEEIIP